MELKNVRPYKLLLLKILEIEFKNEFHTLFFTRSYNCLQNKTPYNFHVNNQNGMNQNFLCTYESILFKNK